MWCSRSTLVGRRASSRGFFDDSTEGGFREAFQRQYWGSPSRLKVCDTADRTVGGAEWRGDRPRISMVGCELAGLAVFHRTAKLGPCCHP